MIIINGDFLCRNLTGIERFAFETCKHLDNLIEKNQIGIYIPKNAKTIPDYNNIKVIISKKECKVFPLWEHLEFGKFVKKNKYTPLDFSNVTPLGTKGIVFIHDIYAKLYSKDFSRFRDKLINKYMCLMYRYATKHAKLLLTVSEFSRTQIANTYKIPKEKIYVIPNGWDHFKEIQPDDSIIKNNPKLQDDFYFTLGSLSLRKNLKWVAEYAKKNPNEKFAISGKMLSGLVPQELEILKSLDNVILLGYVSDEQVKALMQKCTAFVFPSYYEGFGIPPLEALSCGTKIIVSNAASLPEIYENTAYYINPDDTNINLKLLLSKEVESSDKILEKYQYKNSAITLCNLLKKFLQ